MPSVSGFLKKPLPWISVLVLVLVRLLLDINGYLSIILTSIVTLSTFTFNFSKRKPSLQLEKSAEDDQECSIMADEDEYTAKKIEGDQAKEENEKKIMDDDHYIPRSSPSPVILSESECLGRSSTSEDSEVDYWPYQDKMFGSPNWSDGSISDEDSLIEIALPSGHYIGDCKEELHKKLPDSLFKQHALAELLAELNDMNEEDNLIEIDLSMGSIKCPRFEIEA